MFKSISQLYFSILIGSGLFLLFLTSCIEIPPEIPELETSGDKVVLVEDFTGVRCTNCPTAAQAIKNLMLSYEGKVVPVSIHAPKFSAFTRPHDDSKYDFRIDEADKLAELVESEIIGLPSAMFDRYDYDLAGIEGHIINNVTNYANAIKERINIVPQMSISIENNYDPSSRELTTTAIIEPTETIVEPLYITFMLLENKIVDLQTDKEAIIEEYEHNHVLRDIYSDNPTGDKIQQKFIEGEVIEISRTVTIPEAQAGKAWNNPEHMETVVHVHRRENALTSLQTAIKGVTE